MTKIVDNWRTIPDWAKPIMSYTSERKYIKCNPNQACFGTKHICQNMGSKKYFNIKKISRMGKWDGLWNIMPFNSFYLEKYSKAKLITGVKI